ncbi:hypothetical protein SCT_0627 [Sulfuricella sp. T08]|uniref:hypothetical protein n=1 Tax=Sulfuricella sp. T08 TaxID=1632857 RepID=UPI0006179CFF|nr:hypothetical protein [Sulfuricella sp. T08]GAO35243.1 hypothetical protein SCT_0627 [Sulfuricella sp. T08]
MTNKSSAQWRKISLTRSTLAISVALATMGASALSYAADADQDQEKLFKEGLFQREQGNLFTSLEAFQTVLSNQPQLNRVRLELAVAYYRTMNFEESKRQAQLVLDDPKTPENVRLSVLTFLAQVKKDEEAFTAKRHAWEPSVSIGLMHDTNINVGPSSDVLPGGLILSTASRPLKDDAVVLSAGITHRYQSPTPVKIGEKAARFVWQSQANYYRKGYLSKDEFNLDVVTLATGPGWFVPNYWRAAVTGQVDYIRYGDTELANFYSLTPSVTWEIQNGEITWDALFQKRDFSRTVDAGRDSDYAATGVTLGKVFMGGKLALQGGVHVFQEDANLSRFSNDGTEIFLGANMLAWANGSVYGRASQRDVKYDGIDSAIFPLKRDETENRYEIGFNHDIKTGPLERWKLGGSFTHTENSSNISIYDYKRDVTALNLSRTF